MQCLLRQDYKLFGYKGRFFLVRIGYAHTWRIREICSGWYCFSHTFQRRRVKKFFISILPLRLTLHLRMSWLAFWNTTAGGQLVHRYAITVYPYKGGTNFYDQSVTYILSTSRTGGTSSTFYAVYIIWRDFTGDWATSSVHSTLLESDLHPRFIM